MSYEEEEEDIYPPLTLYSDEAKSNYSPDVKAVLDRFVRLYSVFENNVNRAIVKRKETGNVLSDEVIDWIKSLTELTKTKGTQGLVGRNFCRVLFLLVLSQRIYRSLHTNVIEKALDYGIHSVRDLMKEFIKYSWINEKQIVKKIPEERRNVSYAYYLDKTVFLQLDYLVPTYDFPDEPPPILLPFQRKEQIPKPKVIDPEWFRPEGLTDIDIDAGFLPHRTIFRLKQEIEEIWDQNKVPFLVAHAASGKTSIIRVLSKYWMETSSEVYYFSAIDWSWEIAEAILVIARSQKIIVIIDDLHRCHEFNLKTSYIANIFGNPNIKGIIASRPRANIEKMVEKVLIERIKIPSTYSRELIHNFNLLCDENSKKEKKELLKILETHKGNIASLIYELQEPTHKSRSFWKNFVKEKCRYYAYNEKTEPRRWEVILLALSFLRTKEISCTINQLIDFLKPELDLSLQDIERMLFILEENGLVIRERTYDKKETKYRFGYHSEFSNILLKENLTEFKHLVQKRVKIKEKLSFKTLQTILWAWWIENTPLSSTKLNSLRQSLADLWYELPLDCNLWRQRISENKNIIGVQLALLGEENKYLRGNFRLWMTIEHWKTWLLSSGVEERADILEYWIEYTSDQEVKDQLIILDLELLENIEWKEDLGSVDDPGGDGFLPASIHLGYNDLGFEYVEKLGQLLGNEWFSLCASFISDCIRRDAISEFKEFITRLDEDVIQSLPVNELPDALTLGQKISIAENGYLDEDDFKFPNILTSWPGPKPEDIALAVCKEFIRILQQRNPSELNQLLDTDITEEWIRALSNPEINQELDTSKIRKLVEDLDVIELFHIFPDKGIGFLTQFLILWAPDIIEAILTPEILDNISSKIDRWKKAELLELKAFKMILLRDINEIRVQVALSWIKLDLLVIDSISDENLEILIKNTPNAEWFLIIKELHDLIEIPEYMVPERKKQGLKDAEIAARLTEKIVKILRQLPITTIRVIVKEDLKNRTFNEYNYRNFTDTVFEVEKLLEIKLFENWEQIFTLIEGTAALPQQLVLISFLKANPEHISHLTQMLLNTSKLIEFDVLIKVFLSLDNDLIYEDFPQLLRQKIRYSYLKKQTSLNYHTKFTDNRLIKLIILQKDPENFLNEFLPSFLEEQLENIFEILYALTREEKLQKAIWNPFRTFITSDLIIQLIKQIKNTRKIYLLKSLENNSFCILDKMNQNDFINLLIETRFNETFILQKPFINSELIEKYYSELIQKENDKNIFTIILKDFDNWIKAKREPSIFVSGIKSYLNEELIKNAAVPYYHEETYSIMLEYSSEVAEAVRRLTKSWLTSNFQEYNKNLLKIISKAWGHPDALKTEIKRWDNKQQQWALKTLIGLGKNRSFYLDELNSDWTINLFSQELRIEIYVEMVKWLLFDQNERDLNYIIKLFLLDEALVKACEQIPDSDWQNAVFNCGNDMYIIVLRILVVLSHFTRSDRYFAIGQKILNEEKDTRKIQQLLSGHITLYPKEKEIDTKKMLRYYNWTIPIRILQTDPTLYCRIYHDYVHENTIIELKEKEIMALEPESLDTLSYKQITAFLLSLPKKHSSPLIEYLQERVNKALNNEKLRGIFWLFAILILPLEKREHYYREITVDLLISIDWLMVDYIIINYHCEKIEEERSKFKSLYRLVFDSYYSDDTSEQSNYCEICELYPRSHFLEELWQDLINFIPEKADKAILEIDDDEIQNLYLRLKKCNKS